MTFLEFKLALSVELEKYDKDTQDLDDPKDPTTMSFEDWLWDFNEWMDNNPRTEK